MGAGETEGARSRWTGTIVPVVFVLLWSSGFIVPRAFAPYAEPLTFIALRNGGAGAALLAISLAARSPWPAELRSWTGLLWSGALLQGFLLMGVYWAVTHGLPAGVAALIGALQPAATAVIAAFKLNEKLSRGQWLGIAIGFAGVALVVSPKLSNASGIPAALVFVALTGVVLGAYGSILQKRYGEAGDAWTRTAVLFFGATIPAAAGACISETRSIEWSPSLIAVYLWSVFPLAIGATMMLLFMIQRRQAARATSLIYLVPPTAATMAYVGFGEGLTPIQLAGFAVTAAGVFLVTRRS